MLIFQQTKRKDEGVKREEDARESGKTSIFSWTDCCLSKKPGSY
jgi:hypothetical protein